MELILCSACKKGDVEEVQQLLTNNSQININAEDNLKQTPLYIACREGYIQIVRLLLNVEGIDLNHSNNYGESAFWIACLKGHINIVKLLLNHERVDINQASRSGITAFYLACFNRNLEIVKLLLNNKTIDVNKADIGYNRTPLHNACHEGEIQLVEYILASGRDVNLGIKNRGGKTAIDIARETGSKGGGKEYWESKEEYQNKRRNCKKIVELLESFERNPNETRFKLRIQLEYAGNI